MPVGTWVPTGGDQVRLNNQLRAAVQQLTNAANNLLVLKNIMSQMAPASNYSDIETYFGAQAGSGQTLKDVLGTASDGLQGAGVQALIQRFA